MNQYISKSALVAELKRIEHETNYEPFTSEVLGKRYVCKSLLSLLDSIEVKEVDFNKEIETQWNKFVDSEGEVEQFSEIAKHFFELGLNTQHSSINIPNIDDLLEEEGIDPFSEEAKIFKESYYMALEKFKSQKGEKVWK